MPTQRAAGTKRKTQQQQKNTNGESTETIRKSITRERGVEVNFHRGAGHSYKVLFEDRQMDPLFHNASRGQSNGLAARSARRKTNSSLAQEIFDDRHDQATALDLHHVYDAHHTTDSNSPVITRCACTHQTTAAAKV